MDYYENSKIFKPARKQNPVEIRYFRSFLQTMTLNTQKLLKLGI